MLGIVDPPSSGLGDRLGAWLSILALATLRKEDLIFFKDSWPNATHAGLTDGQRNQNKDVAVALRCIESDLWSMARARGSCYAG